MDIRLFDIESGKPVPAAHCYTVQTYKDVIDFYGEDAGKVMSYLYFLYSLNPQENPFCLIDSTTKEEVVKEQVCPNLDLDNPIVLEAKIMTEKVMKTPEYRLFEAFKGLLERMTEQISSVVPDLSKANGNMTQIKEAVKAEKDLRMSYKEAFEDYMRSLGTAKMSHEAYDEDDDDDLE